MVFIEQMILQRYQLKFPAIQVSSLPRADFPWKNPEITLDGDNADCTSRDHRDFFRASAGTRVQQSLGCAFTTLIIIFPFETALVHVQQEVVNTLHVCVPFPSAHFTACT